jgi:hypothetical protein
LKEPSACTRKVTEKDLAEIHELKTWPEPFRNVLHGLKNYEIRKNDRGFSVGDELWLREWDPSTEEYTGAHFIVDVLYMTNGGEWGIPPELCVMSIGRRRRTIGCQQ